MSVQRSVHMELHIPFEFVKLLSTFFLYDIFFIGRKKGVFACFDIGLKNYVEDSPNHKMLTSFLFVIKVYKENH